MTNALYKIIKNILFLKSKEFPDKEKERKLMQRFSASEVGTLWQGLGSVPQELAARQEPPIYNFKEINSTSSNLGMIEVAWALSPGSA